MSKSQKDSINDIKSDQDSLSNKQLLNRKKKRDSNISSEIFDQNSSTNNEIICSICLGEEKLIPNCFKCSTCSSYFHIECYNLFTFPATQEDKINIENVLNNFECYRCKEEKKYGMEFTCYICKRHSGIIKKIEEEKFLHHFCYVFFKDNLNYSKGGNCNKCSRKKIQVLKCEDAKCKEKYHIQCAIDHKIIFCLPYMRSGDLKVDKNNFNEKIPFYCEIHNYDLIKNFKDYTLTMQISKNDKIQPNISETQKNENDNNIEKENNIKKNIEEEKNNNSNNKISKESKDNEINNKNENNNTTNTISINNSSLVKKENIISDNGNTNNKLKNMKINNNINIINDIIKENIYISNNLKLEENQENNISSNINLHSFNLTCSTDNKTNVNSILNINNILTMNSNNNHYLNPTNKNNINNINKNNSIINKIKENLNLKQEIKSEKDNFKTQKIFVTNSIPLFSNLSKYQLIGTKKRKRDEQPEKTMDIFVVSSTPKKIKYDRFPLLSRDNPKKLINNSILFFK